MREIKFRAWDKENNKMVYSNEVYPSSAYKFEFELLNGYKFTLSKIVDRINTKDDLDNEHIIECFEKVDAKIMQYTRLKDKNGKEIYEGDILSYKRIIYTDCSKTEIEGIEEESFIEIITYAPIASVVKPHSKNVRSFGYDSVNKECLILGLTSDDVEVIGNVYDNKDLLI